MQERIGRFKISIDQIYKNTEDVEKLFVYLKFIPLRAEYIYTRDIEYIGHSHLFDITKECEDAPFYEITINKDKDLITDIKIERK